MSSPISNNQSTLNQFNDNFLDQAKKSFMNLLVRLPLLLVSL